MSFYPFYPIVQSNIERDVLAVRERGTEGKLERAWLSLLRKALGEVYTTLIHKIHFSRKGMTNMTNYSSTSSNYNSPVTTSFTVSRKGGGAVV